MTTTTQAPYLAGIAEWDGNALAITDEETLSGMRRTSLSASTSKSFQGCAARWAGERLLRDQEAENPFDPAPLGTAAHSVMEDLFALPPNERTKENAYRILEAKADLQWARKGGETQKELRELAGQRAEWVAAVQHVYIRLWEIEEPAHVIVKGLEDKLDGIEVAGVPMVGYLDRVNVAQDFGPDAIEICDYKTGAKIPNRKYGDDHGDQLRLYKVAYETKHKVPVAKARVLYTANGVDVPVDLSDDAVEKTLAKWRMSWAKHNQAHDSGRFPVKVSGLCGWCPLVNACPAAAAAGKTAKKDGLPSKEELGIFDPDAPESLAAVRAKARAAHMDSAGDAPREPTNLEDPMPRIPEGKTWEEQTPDGQLNPNAYAATAVFGLAELAVEHLHKDGQKITGPNVKALARTFHAVVAKAQESWTGSTGFQDGASTRMRGALRTVLTTMPLPWGKTSADWAAWQDRATQRCRAITTVALGLWEDGVAEEPWKALAVDPEPADDFDDGFDDTYTDEYENAA